MKSIGVAVLFALSTFVITQAKVEVPKEIAAIYTAQEKALAKGDVKGFFRPYAASFVIVAPDGKKSTLFQFKKDVIGLCKGSLERGLTTQYTACKVRGSTVEVSYISIIKIQFKDKSKSMRLREVATDTWEKGAQGWKETKTVEKEFAPAK